MPVELWLSIFGADGWEVSSYGRVRRLAYTITKHSRGGGLHNRHFPSRVVPLQRHSNGYLSVRLYPDDRTMMVSRLVCAAFNGPPPTPAYHADHINGDRADNHSTNLRWLSPTANRALRIPLRGERHNMAKLNEVAVHRIRTEITTSTEPRMDFDMRLAAEYGVTHESIRNVRLGRTWRPTDAAE
jgi:hypothetical protein